MTDDFPELFVLRHGETRWNVEGRHQGRQDSPLTARGRRQAGAQGDILVAAGLKTRNLSYYCSPQGRARDTAAIALRTLNQTPQTDNKLCEISFGDWEGLTLAEIKDDRPDIFTAGSSPFNWQFHAPGGEAFEAMSSRCQSFLESLTGPSVIFTHGITSRVLRGLWLGLDIDGMAELPGGQGCVYHLQARVQHKLVA